MTDARGRMLQNMLARYLQVWWPLAESAGAGRQGTDVINTPGVSWECKTVRDFARNFRPQDWVRQARGHGRDELPVVVCFPGKIGGTRVDAALAIVPLQDMMALLQSSGYTPLTWADLEREG